MQGWELFRRSFGWCEAGRDRCGATETKEKGSADQRPAPGEAKSDGVVEATLLAELVLHLLCHMLVDRGPLKPSHHEHVVYVTCICM